MSNLEMIRFVRECYPEYKGQLYMKMVDLAKLFGMSDDNMRRHINQYCVDFYRPVKEKMYNVLEVLESIQKTKNKSA